MARLRTFVHVGGRAYGPGVDVPADVAAKITNPKAWDGDPPTPSQDHRGGGEGSGGSSSEGSVEPPRSGAGSTKAAWAEHAAARGVAVPDSASREDIIAAVDAAKE